MATKLTKIKTVTCHVLREKKIDKMKEKQSDTTSDDDDSEDDYVAGTFGSDSD